MLFEMPGAGLSVRPSFFFVVAISGQFRSGLAADGTPARALGAQQAIAKPFGRAELVGALRNVIGAR
jgi:hypothetical protein